jgi:TRAP-type C4-dicarboxylate transport system permease small subunit
MYNLFKQFDNILEKVSLWGLVSCLTLMLVFSFASIIFRWFNTSLLWIDPLVRHMVFLSAFFGGSLATSKGNHIRIDLASKIIEKVGGDKLEKVFNAGISLVCAVAVLWIVDAAIDFTKIELQYGKPVFWGIHSGFLVAIIPFGFGIISYRFFFQFLKALFGNESIVTEEKS